MAPLAQQEIVEAADYIFKNTSDTHAAETLLEQIYKAFELIAAMPRLGKPRSEFGRGLRSREVGTYTVFYRPHRQFVENHSRSSSAPGPATGVRQETTEA